MTTIMWEVGVTYCTDVHFNHHHESAKEATREYADQLFEALDPLTPEQKGGQKVIHVKKVYLRGMNEDGDITRNVNSGVIECEHQAAL